jgi:maltooligosyltrehalose trehalohydrolase
MQAERLNRRVYLIAESNRNDPRFLRPPPLGGYGLDGQWNDDFHHALHTLLTGEHDGYYQDFGRLQHLVKAWREGFIYSDDYSVYRQRRHGASSHDIPAQQFVVCAQNHDQVGNRMLGERLSQLVSFEALTFPVFYQSSRPRPGNGCAPGTTAGVCHLPLARRTP